MRLFEIERKYFFLKEGTVEVLEAYKNPAEELRIDYKPVEDFPGNYNVYVYEKDTNEPVLQVVLTLNKNGSIDVGGISPADTPKNNKLVYTSVGTQNNGADMGFRAMRWLNSELSKYAKSQGYSLKKIVSGTRYTGARAKNNPGVDVSGLPKNFNVNLPLKESYEYNCDTDILKIMYS